MTKIDRKNVFTALAILFLAAFWLEAGPACAKVYVAEPLLVPQPSFAGMTFYVYRPYNLPANWYATFDGYPVTRNKDGVWVYGTQSAAGLIPTHFIVGSVVPSMAGLTPFADPIQVSSTVTLSHPPVPPEMEIQVHEQAVIQAPVPSGDGQPFVAQQPAMAQIPAGPAFSTYMPDWLFNERFMALGNWKSSVDRVGVLHRPCVPVAWHGDSPKVIYAWNGRGWSQLMTREGERPVDALRSGLYRLTKQAHGSGVVWYEADIPLLAQQAANWGYYWMGEIFPGWSEQR